MNLFANIWTEICEFFNKYIVEPFVRINVKDVIDILLLAVVLYGVYRFFRDRRAGRVMLGLAFVVVASAVVSVFQLPALSYIVRLFAASAFFCTVVIFQPEFRDALESLGNWTFLNPNSNSISRKRMGAAKSVAEETVDAVTKMSESHTGALIVFEGLTKLGDYIRTGHIVDARVSSKLLRNIFFNHSPLHDGAMVIRDMRIFAASCVLPSSTRQIADFGNLGTRHRAAVGVTEVSDALVVVVSEQTGAVSVAQNGKLLRHVDAKTLYDILMTYIAGNAYLRQKRANMRKEYLQIMEEIAHVESPVKPSADESLAEKQDAPKKQEAPQTEAAIEENANAETLEKTPQSDDSTDMDI